MHKSPKIILSFGLSILLLQIVVFRDHLLPAQWGKLKVSGLACTCPDEKVVNGSLYLRWITPDSLKKHKINYSEIYVDQRPSIALDPMGIDLYMVEGRGVGKRRVSANDPWCPVVKVEGWKQIDLLKEWGIQVGFVLQICLFGLLYRFAQKKRFRS